jgi:hypothetical protein
VLAPTGRPRRLARAGAFALTGLVVLARLLLATDYPIDAVYSLLLGWITVGFAFAFLVPEDVFPVSYARGGKAAHLDLGGSRGDAIVAAVRDQLGFTVTEIEPFGLAGSGGSSPLRMRVAEIDGYLFGKIYSTSHLRADRWYKVGRSILYGRLEDESHSGRCGGLRSTRTTRCACSATSGSAWRPRTGSWSSPPTASTCS